MAVRGLVGPVSRALAYIGTPAGASRPVVEDALFYDVPSHVYGTPVAPTRVSYRDSLTTNASPQTSSSFDVQAGDLIVIMGYMANEQEFLGDFTWTGTGVVTPQERGTTLNNTNTCNMYVSTIGVTATATARTVTGTRTITADAQRLWGFSVTVWRNHGGVGNITKTISSGAPSLNILTSTNSAIEVGAVDWNAVNATTRTWRSVNGTAITEDSWYHGGVYYDIFHGYSANAGVAGVEVVGLTAPSNTMSTMAAVEVLAKYPSTGQGYISQPHTLSSLGAQTAVPVTEVTYGSISTGSGNASVVVTKPSGTVDGDGLIAIAFGDTDDTAMTAPAGWTLAGSFTTATYIHAYVWTKIAASEGASYTFSGPSGASHVMSVMRLQGVNTSAPLNVSPVFNGTLSTSASQVAPTITTTVAGAMMVSAWGMQGGGVASYSAPTGMTERADFASGDAWLFNAVDTQLLGAAGATGTRTTTTDVRFYTAVSFAVAPAVLVLNKSGTGAISQTHTATSTGNKLASGIGAISVTHTVTSTGNQIGPPTASGTGAISQTHTLDSLGTKVGTRIVRDATNAPGNNVALTAANIPSQSVTGSNGTFFQDSEAIWWYRQNLPSGTSGQYRMAVTNSKVQAFGGRLFIPTPSTFSINRVILTSRWASGNSFRLVVTTARQLAICNSYSPFTAYVTTAISGGIDPALKYYVTLNFSIGTVGAADNTLSGDSNVTLNVYLVGSDTPISTVTASSVNLGTSTITHYDVGSLDTAATAIDLRWTNLQWENERTLPIPDLVTVGGTPVADGTGTIDQTSDLTSTGLKAATGTGAIEQTHDVTCGSYKIASGTSIITQTLDVTSTGSSAASGTSVIAVAHTVTDTGFKQGIGTGLVTQTHSLIATSGKVSTGTGVISQSSAVTSTGIKQGSSTGLITQTHTVTCTSGKTIAGTGIIAQTHGITSTGDKQASGTSLITQTHTLDAVSGKIATGTGEITQTHTVTSTGETGGIGTSEILQTHTITSTGEKMGIGSGDSIDQTHTLTATSGKVSTGTGLISVTHGVTSTGVKSGLGVGVITQSHTLDATNIKMGIGTGAITQTNALTSTGNRVAASGTSAIVQTHTIVSTGHGPNMVTNPSVVLDTTWWGVSAGTGGAATGARVLTGGPAGIDTFYRVTQTVTQTAVGSGATYSSSNFNTDPGLIVTAGDRVVGTAWVRSSVNQSLYFYIQHYNAAGAAVTTGRTAAIPVVANEWTLLELGGILVPPGASDTIRVRLLVYNATVLWQAGDTLDVTGLTASSIPTMVSGTGVIAQSHTLDCTAVKMGLGSPNLLLNPGAEDDTQWTSNINGVVRTFDTTEQHSGLRSALQTRTTTTNSPTYLAQTYGPALTAPGVDRTYTFSIWGMTQEPNHTLSMLVQQTIAGVNSYPVSPNTVALTPGVWSQVSWTITIPATVQTFRLYGQIHRNGHLGTVSVGQKAWLDDGSIIDQSNPALISQTHTLTSSSNKIAVGTGLISQTHMITSTGDASVSGTSVIEQVVDLASTGIKAAFGTGAISQSNIVTSVGENDAFGFGSITQTHTLISTGLKSGIGTGVIAQTHTLTCVSGKVASGTGTISQTSTVTDTGWKMGIGVGALSQAHTLTGVSGKVVAGTSVITQTHTVTDTGWKMGISTGAIAQSHTLTATSGKIVSGAGEITQSHEITSAGAGATEGTSLIIQSHDVSSTGYKSGLGTGEISQTSSLVATSGKVSAGTGAVSQSHTITSTGAKSGIGTGLITQASALTAVSGKVSTGTVVIAQTHTATSTGTKLGIGTSTITQTSTLVAISGKISSGTGSISQSHEITSTGNQLFSTHSVFDPVDPPAPVGYYEDGQPRIRLGSNFYTYGSGVVDWTCSGGRLYIPENTPCIGQPVSIYAWVRTYTSSSANPPDLSGDTPIAQGSTVMVAGWNEVTWTPFEFNPADAGEPPQMVFIGYEMFGTAVGGYVFVSEFGMGGPEPVFAQDGSHLVLAEADALRRSAFEIGGGDEGNSSAWYGTDIVLSETALIQRAGNGSIPQSHELVSTGFKSGAGTGAITQSSLLVSLGESEAIGQAVITQSHTVTSTGFKTASGTSAITQTHTLIGVSNKVAVATGAISQTHTVTSTGTKTGIGTGLITQTHSLIGVSGRIGAGTGAIAQTNTCTSTGIKSAFGTGIISQGNSLTSTGNALTAGTGVIEQSNVLTSEGIKRGIGTGLITQSSLLISEGLNQNTGQGAIAQTHEITSTGASQRSGTGAIAQIHTVESVWTRSTSGTGSITQNHFLTSEGIEHTYGTVSITQDSSLSALGFKGAESTGLISLEPVTITGLGTKQAESSGLIEVDHTITSDGFGLIKLDGTGLIVVPHLVNATGSGYHLDWVIIKGDPSPAWVSVKTEFGVFPATVTIKQ